MVALNFARLLDEMDSMLQSTESIVLATRANDRPAQSVSPINDGLTVMFSTNSKSKKIAQIKKDRHVTLVAGNLKIEAVAELFGHPRGHMFFSDEYAWKFPRPGKKYLKMWDDLLVIAKPVKLSLYKNLGKPCEDVLEPETGRAYRVDL